ncbi:NUZM, NADH-ubiquinone oxidoreductase 21.3 kDa subunit [Pterulicium gracile]|uniref:NUZM, NADH-ubiquinone oxidoreductase 21.3 kDa subunit n=1 Tax=Pterulicium gracile TaxID=1884261 RepID=A0A5C3QTG9_9AGAR|nr:NUZM, NADH-ubiquinone oxidoreductase 21.3 kDa subunit [Pterula gracilis]
MATRKAAESTLYHLKPKGFWKKFRDTVVVNPEISSGLPLADQNRTPQPASRHELYSTPATKASDPAENPYWKRDVRRAYPRLSVVTQNELSTLLIEHHRGESIAAPQAGSSSTPVPVPELTSAIKTIATEGAHAFSKANPPPSYPIPYKRWTPERSPDAPHDENAYWPMQLYK